MGDSDEIKAARRDLGRRLAQLRKAADHTQHSFARLVQYARSSVANTETGHQYPDRAFWARCDAILQTGGVLAEEYDRIAERARQQRRRSAVQSIGTGPWPVAVIHTRPDVGSDDDGSVLWEHEGSIDARRLTLKSCNDNDARLTYLEDEVGRAIADNERFTPAVLVARMRPLRIYVDQLMGGRQHPPQRVRLYSVAAYMSGLLGALALDLGAFRVAHAYAAEAFDLADAAHQPDLQAWARATQSLIAYYTGDYHDALAYAQDGLRRAGTGPHSIRLTINGKARALARLGDRYGVDKAVDYAFNSLSECPSSSQVSASLALGAYCQARTAANAATAYLALGCGTDVTTHLVTAIDAFDAAALRGPQALSRLDLATAYLRADNPEPEQASALALEALTLTADQRYESVNQRARQFLATARPFAQQPQLRQVAELLCDRIRIGVRTPPALPSPS
ncbi:helix-turn-helix transcriptional regulator [Micromonospora sp. NPDC047738]|uniref:helix-turn-helix domain-containing protein n=1 Tax=Micromonospora sp. NPDC047738 TaxID=3155741 RepID=UPI0033E0603F